MQLSCRAGARGELTEFTIRFAGNTAVMTEPKDKDAEIEGSPVPDPLEDTGDADDDPEAD